MKITMARRDIWLGGETNTAYREGKTYDVPKERRDFFVQRGSAADAEPAPRTRRRQRDLRTGVELEPGTEWPRGGNPAPRVEQDDPADASARRDD